MSENLSSKTTKRGSVLIVGAGIGGMQSALDLANSGFKVYMVQKDSAIGGTMVMLDKTFPTGDCSMCMISPKMVEVGRHLNIDVLTLSEVMSVEGQPGDFKVKVKRHARYVDSTKCTGCGICETKCPKKVISEYEQGLTVRKAIFSLFPQAVPNTRVIDKDHCIYFEKGKCRACEKFCDARAIDFNQQEKEIELNVGAIILSPGLSRYDASVRQELGFGRWPNVVSSIQFERILSPSGPYKGEVKRPSDETHPKKIAWIQCVGSRDPHHANPWCSSVCCMYATKQAVIAREHDKSIEPAIFYMELRAYGKDFDKYVDRAKNEHGVRYRRAMISAVREESGTGNLVLRYALEDGKLVDETFDMVVLSIGFQPHSDVADVAKTFGIDLNEHRFAKTTSFQPIESSRPGVYVTGIFQGPKDIPETVMQGSAVAGGAMALLGDARGTETVTKDLPPQLDVTGQEPRIGVFVCHCGINIGGVADVPAVRDYARTLPHVVHVEDNLFSCSQDNQEKMKHVIKEKGINRVVVASCSPRTHEPLFQETIRGAGLNKYLFEMANIRDQNTWVHMNDPKAATEKAKDLVRMAVAKAAFVEPLEQVMLPVTKGVLVIGGGVAGMEAALGVAEQGFKAYLIEKTGELGGVARRLRTTWTGEDIGTYVDKLIQRVKANPLVEVFTEMEAKEFSGVVGNFTTTLHPVSGKGPSVTVDHGATILATGGREYKPTEYLYTQHPGVLTHLDLDQAIKSGDPRVKEAKTVAFIQCVGSRIPERPYCSKVCCTHSLESALKLKSMNPAVNVLILYRDIRSYGLREDLYREARNKGVLFIRYDLDEQPQLTAAEGGKLSLSVTDPMLRRPIRFFPDLVVLAAAILPNENKHLFELFKVPVNNEGFLIEAHAKLRPVDFASEGLFLAGLAHYAKPIDESITQAKAAVARAMTILSREGIYVGGVVASVNPDKCAACLTCVRTCPYDAPHISEEGYAVIDPASCRGCGACVAECPGKAIALKHFTDEQILAKTDALFQAKSA